MKENINELLEEINDQELEGEVVGGIATEDAIHHYTGTWRTTVVCPAPY